VANQLPGHAIGLTPGAVVPTSGPQRDQARTSTQRAFDFSIDERTGDHGFLLHSWTGNLALLDTPLPGDAFARIQAVTGIRGRIGLTPVASSKLVFLDPEFRKLELQGETDLESRYMTTEFGQAMDLEQGGELLVAAYTGAIQQDIAQRGFVQLFFPETLLAGALRLEQQQLDPNLTRLDEMIAGQPPYVSPPGVAPPDVFRRLRVDPTGLDSPRDVEFSPQLSVVVPANGETVRGAVRVNLLVRDDRISRVQCALRSAAGISVPPGTFFETGGTLSSAQKSLGFSWNRGAVTQRPVCSFAELASGEYELEVTGVGPSPAPVARVRFRYEATP
jgi:hypothetical protein